VTLELVGGLGTLRTLTSLVGPDRLTVELGPEDVIPPAGTRARFRVDVAGSPVAGDARVRGAQTVETAEGRAMLLDLEVTSLDPGATQYLRRTAFRDSVLRYAERNPDGHRILASADGRGPHAPTAPDTRPVREREGRWVDEVELLPRSERPLRPAASGGAARPSRKRPKPGRHTWELEDRFRGGRG
jgi:hypothetical protein